MSKQKQKQNDEQADKPKAKTEKHLAYSVTAATEVAIVMKNANNVAYIHNRLKSRLEKCAR